MTPAFSDWLTMDPFHRADQFRDATKMVPASRSTDPATSRAAIESHSARESHCETIWHAVRDKPGQTFRELAQATGIEAHEVMKRLNDLHRTGRIRKGEARKCRVAGNQATTWSVV